MNWLNQGEIVTYKIKVHTKGESIEFLCKKWDIDIKETVAFGDHIMV